MLFAGIVNAMMASMIPVAVGDVLAGKYRIDRILGAGGMGIVVAAEHLQLRQIVAIKFVLPDALGSSDALERFLREARAVVRLKSEHVARVIDVGALASGSPYMVMEFLSGLTLGALVDREPNVAVDSLVYYVIQACEALAEAHSLGIIHRDLKPENLFLTHSVSGAPLVKVLDFGVSKMESVTGTRGLTRTAALMGSPLYMAPEQMRSARDATAGSDIWGLGVVLYYLLSHSYPFDAESMPELCLKVTLESPIPLHVRRPDVPALLEDVIMRCLEKDPANRFANAAELASALEPFAPPEASAAVERARLIARGMHPHELSGTLEAPPGQPGGRSSRVHTPRSPTPRSPTPRSATPRSITADEQLELAKQARRRRYLGVAVAVASAALVVGLAVPLVFVYLEPEPSPAARDSSTSLQNANVASPEASTPPALSARPVLPFAPAVDAATLRPTTDAGRPGPQRWRPPPPPSASQAPPPPGRHDDIPTLR